MASAWGQTVRLPWHGGPRPPAARNRCRARATRASGQGLVQSGVGRLVEAKRRTAGNRRRRVRRPKPAAARPTGLSTSSGPRGPRRPNKAKGLGRTARASRPSSRPAGAEVVPAGTADRRHALSGVGGHGSRLRGQPVDPPPVFLRGESGSVLCDWLVVNHLLPHHGWTAQVLDAYSRRPLSLRAHDKIPRP